jgi:hypothetical protein
MYDELFCDAELPDTDVPPGACFQTKAFPEPFLFRYRITKAGRLIDAYGRDLECDGYLEFYYYPTRSAQDFRWAEYRARFCDGQMKSIARVQEEPEEADERVIYGLASYRVFAHAAPSGFMSDTSEDVETLRCKAEINADRAQQFSSESDSSGPSLATDALFEQLDKLFNERQKGRHQPE